MTKDDVLNAMPDLSMADLHDISFKYREEYARREKNLVRSVKVSKQENKVTPTFILSHEKHGSFACRQVAFAGRWRVWKIKDKQRIMVIEEGGYGADGLEGVKFRIASGHFDNI